MGEILSELLATVILGTCSFLLLNKLTPARIATGAFLGLAALSCFMNVFVNDEEASVTTADSTASNVVALDEELTIQVDASSNEETTTIKKITESTSRSTQGSQIDNNYDVEIGVSFYDETDNRPIHDRCSIWFRGMGNWYVKNVLIFGGARREIGSRSIGTQESIFFYPDGRDGVEVEIPILLMKELIPKDSTKDLVVIKVWDSIVEVIGPAVKGRSLTFDRFR